MSTIKISAQEQEERKSRIIYHAFRLFCRSGLEKVSMKDIAAASEVGEKSLYRYFITKTELIKETANKLWLEIANELTAGIDGSFREKSGYQQIELLLDGFRSLYETHSDYVLFSYEYKQFMIRHYETLPIDDYEDILHPLQQLYVLALEKGKADGTISADRDSNDLYFALWGLMRGYVVKIVIYDRMYTGENVWLKEYEIARQFILSGLQNGLLPVSNKYSQHDCARETGELSLEE